MHRALMIERVITRKLRDPAGLNPSLYVSQRSVLQCGCCVWLGQRSDNHEAATAAVSCGPEHELLMSAFQQTFRQSLEAPTDRPAIDVIDEYLLAAEVWNEQNARA